MRDFFYNKGDVLITILIVIVAATVIYFRVGVVMGDSDPLERLKNLVAPLFSSGQEASPEEGAAVEEEPASDTGEPPEQAGPPPEEGQPEEEPAVEGPPAQEEDPPDESGVSAASVTVTVNAGDAASTIADKLLAAGAISDKQAFLDEVNAQGATSRLRQGTFTIPAGSSINDIIKLLTN